MNTKDHDAVNEALREAWDDAAPSAEDLARLDAQVLARIERFDPAAPAQGEATVLPFPAPQAAQRRVRTRSGMRAVTAPSKRRAWLLGAVAAAALLVLVGGALRRVLRPPSAGEPHRAEAPVRTAPVEARTASPATPTWSETPSPDALWTRRHEGNGGVLLRGAITIGGHHDDAHPYRIDVPDGPFAVQPIGTRARVERLSTSIRVRVEEGAVRVVCVGPSPTALATLHEGEQRVFPFACERYRGDEVSLAETEAHALFEAAHQAHDAGSHEEALALLDRLLRVYPSHASVPNAYLLRGRIRCASGRLTEGRDDLVQARTRDPVLTRHANEHERECDPARRDAQPPRAR